MIDKVRSSHRLQYPVEKVNGEWKRVSWDNAMDKIAKKLNTLREQHGPDSVQFLGSS